MIKTLLIAILLCAGLVACSEEDASEGPHPASLREGCRTPPPGHGPQIASIGVRSKIRDMGAAWAVVVLKDVPRLEGGVPDKTAIAALIQRYLTDIDARDDEKMFGGKYSAVVNLELSPGRLAQTVKLPYVCAVTLDHAAWPVN